MGVAQTGDGRPGPDRIFAAELTEVEAEQR
jgi:hypothetical protein